MAKSLIDIIWLLLLKAVKLHRSKSQKVDHQNKTNRYNQIIPFWYSSLLMEYCLNCYYITQHALVSLRELFKLWTYIRHVAHAYFSIIFATVRLYRMHRQTSANIAYKKHIKALFVLCLLVLFFNRNRA